MPAKIVKKYLNVEHLPTIWCPGCGNGIVLHGIIEAIDAVGLDQDKTVIVSGIGCSSRAAGYLNFDTLHTTHGRGLAFAAGIKLARPELNVIVITGDGDSTAIGGNHFIHAARRNFDITTIIFNNQIYGMTGGQYSPTTPVNARTTTSPYGEVEPTFDICNLAAAAGATYVARAATFNPKKISVLVAEAIRHKGFSVVDVMTQCPPYFGRLNKMPAPTDLLQWQREHTIGIEQAKRHPERVEGRLMLGELVRRNDRPEGVSAYQALTAEAMARKAHNVAS